MQSGAVAAIALARRALVAELAVGIVLENVAAVASRPRRRSRRVARTRARALSETDATASDREARPDVAAGRRAGGPRHRRRRRRLRDPVASKASIALPEQGSSTAAVAPRSRNRRAARLIAFLHAEVMTMRAGIGDDAAGRREMRGDRGAQRGQARRVAVPSVSAAAPPRASCLSSKRRQVFSGNSAGVRPARERNHAKAGRAGPDSAGLPTPGRQATASTRRCGSEDSSMAASAVSPRRTARRRRRAGCRPGFEQPLDHQGFVGADNRVAGDLELFGQTPDWRAAARRAEARRWRSPRRNWPTICSVRLSPPTRSRSRGSCISHRSLARIVPSRAHAAD